MAVPDFRLPTRLRGFVRALVPVVCGPGSEVHADDLITDAERFLAAMPAHFRAGLLAGMVAVEQSARLDPRNLGRPFSRLAPHAAARHWAGWWHGPAAMHQLARGLRMVVAFCYYELPKVKADMGYRPEEWIAQVSKRRLEAWGPEIAKAEAAVLAPDPLRPPPPKGPAPHAHPHDHGHDHPHTHEHAHAGH